MNLMPTPRTKALASTMIAEAKQTPPLDVLLNHLDRIEELGEQSWALFGVLLGACTPYRPPGRTPKAFIYTIEERREAHRLYNAGDRTPEVLAAEREYQAGHKRRARARQVVRSDA